MVNLGAPVGGGRELGGWLFLGAGATAPAPRNRQPASGAGGGIALAGWGLSWAGATAPAQESTQRACAASKESSKVAPNRVISNKQVPQGRNLQKV